MIARRWLIALGACVALMASPPDGFRRSADPQARPAQLISKPISDGRACGSANRAVP